VKLVLFSHAGGTRAGALTDNGVVPLAGHMSLESLIAQFASERADLERQVAQTPPLPIGEVRLLPPLPRPGKILCSTNAYTANSSEERPPLLLTLKSAESVIGPGQTVQLPPLGSDWQFVPEAELGLVIGSSSKAVKAADWRSAVFGYTCVIDVMAQGDVQFGRDFWLAKSDTLGPLGPCIVTADEIADPQTLRVRSTVNGEPAQDYSLSDAQYSIAEHVELATTIMTLKPGDVLACGTSRQGLRPLSNGDHVQVEISGIGRLEVNVSAAAEVRA
jgi:2-keto-4-pentenoate hydratase/2-oxohepta-3-ene-1,7-dioic acid hydratase in catechol pathway